MMLSRKRAEAIRSCFESGTYCKWATSDYLYELTPWGSRMVLKCGRIEDDVGIEVSWDVTGVFPPNDGYLMMILDGGDLALRFTLEPKEGCE